MYYGVVLAVLFFVAYVGCITDLIRRRQDDALAVVVGLLAAGFTAVSYTHLDVYKRQCRRCAEASGVNRREGPGAF